MISQKMRLPAILAVAICALFIGCARQGFTAQPASGTPPAPDGYAWRLNPKLSDEFDGGTLDTNKWVPSHPNWKGRDPSHFAATNVFLSGGELCLRTTPLVTNLAKVANRSNDIWIASACVSSRKPEASYGYYEARIKASELSMTSSFWMGGNYTEIDVVEELGKPQFRPDKARLMMMNTHYFKEGRPKEKAAGSTWRMSTGSADNYHVYGVWWKDKDTAWYYHDGEKVAEVQLGGSFDEPMWILFDTEAFAWDGFPSIESLNDPAKNTMRVDWVRSWELVRTNEIAAPR